MIHMHHASLNCMTARYKSMVHQRSTRPGQADRVMDMLRMLPVGAGADRPALHCRQVPEERLDLGAVRQTVRAKGLARPLRLARAGDEEAEAA